MARGQNWVVLAVLWAGCGKSAGEAAPSSAVSSPAAEPAANDEVPRCPEARVPLARRIGGTLAEVCERAAPDPMALDSSHDFALSGGWRGEYAGDSVGESTRFDATLSVFAGTVTGATTEPNTFGMYGYAELEASVVGDVYRTRQVVFLKTYRSGATDHSVLYTGRLDEAGKRIEGRWRVSGGTSGTFWMEKI